MLSAAIGLGTSIIAGNKEEEAAAEALENSAEAMQDAYAAIEQFYNTGNVYTDPFTNAGGDAATLYGSQDLFGELSEAEQYNLDQNMKALRMQQSASGNRQSGMAAKSVSGLASQAYTDKYNTDYETLINQLNYGSAAAGTVSDAANAAGSSIASIYTGGAELSNAYTLASGQASANRWETAGTAAQGFVSS